MSRSLRKVPISGITTAKSEADWKAKAARKLRVATRLSLSQQAKGEALSGKRWEVSNRWDGPKDGKSWFGKAYPKDMRK
jgi:hypothetical protein